MSDIIAQFEEAWSRRATPAIRAFLAAASQLDSCVASPTELLEELVKIDLEYRWRRDAAGATEPPESRPDAPQLPADDGFPERPTIEDYLKRFPELSSGRQVSLDVIAEEYRVRWRWGDRPPQDEYLTRFPARHRELLPVLGAVEDELAIEAALRGEPFSLATQAPSAAEEQTAQVAFRGRAPTTSFAPRYRKLNFHRGGGLGEIWVARDEEVPRRVALKEIRPQYADNPSARDRFLFESLITGALEHPGIVPVYGLGRSPDGELFYAMRFIHGITLREAIQRFHDGGAGSLELRRMLQRFIDVCNVIEYAHSRGVIHRDLKPENVMLGDYGETLVVDWGLAKWIGGPNLSADELFHCGAAANPTTSTQVGEIIGTPAYMSPEQAAGERHSVDRPSDIYSLGATLFGVLTGEPPFQGSDALPRLKRGEIPAAHRVNRRAPLALSAICRKAMAPQPEDRYSSARALAEDVENWLADEKVIAHPENLREKAARWMRRHKTWTQAIAAALLIVTLVSAGAAMLIDAARRNASAARREATSMFQTARGTTNELLKGVTEDLAEVPGAQAARTRLLERAAASLEQLTRLHSRDPELRAELARSYVQLARLRRELNKLTAAESALKRAAAAFEELSRHGDPDLAYRLDCAISLSELGRVQSLAERHEEGLASLNAAAKLFDELATARPDWADLRSERAECRVNRAVALFYLARTGDAEQEYRRAIADLTELAASQRTSPDYPRHLYRLARSYNNLAALLSGTPREEALLAAEKRCRELTGAHPAVLHYQDLLGKVQTTLGDTYLHELLRTELAVSQFRGAVKTYERLSQTNPHVPDYFLGLSEANIGLANALSESQQTEPARKSYQNAATASGQALALSDSQQYRLSAAKARRGLSQLAMAEHDYKTALASADQAIAYLPPAESLDESETLDLLRAVRGDRCRSLLELERLEEFLEEFNRLDALYPNESDAVGQYQLVAAYYFARATKIAGVRGDQDGVLDFGRRALKRAEKALAAGAAVPETFLDEEFTALRAQPELESELQAMLSSHNSH